MGGFPKLVSLPAWLYIVLGAYGLGKSDELERNLLFAPWFEFESARLGSKVVAGPLLLYSHLASKEFGAPPLYFRGTRPYVTIACT